MMRSAKKTEVMLLVRGTGNEKSDVVQIVECICCSITIVVEETLTLAVDQCSKITQSKYIHGHFLTFQLNSVKKIDIINKLYSRLTYLKRVININIFLYTSSEFIIHDP